MEESKEEQVPRKNQESKGSPLSLLFRKFLPRARNSGNFLRISKRMESQMGALVDAFASFAIIDKVVNHTEADLILDMLRSTFPEVDHSWLSRRLRKSVASPQPLQTLAGDLRHSMDEGDKRILGLQLYTLVSAAGRSNEGKESFEMFMRRLGEPQVGAAIVREMTGEESDVPDAELPFEKLLFGGTEADISLPAAAEGYQFRLYRSGNLILLRNTGRLFLLIDGKSLPTGGFLRIRERQEMILPGWTLSYADLRFFLDVRKMDSMPALYLEVGKDGLVANRTRVRTSEVRVAFGLDCLIETLKDTEITLSDQSALQKGAQVHCWYHDRVIAPGAYSLSINHLRKLALQSGRRYRLASDKQEYLVSNDASALKSGDMLLGAKLAPRFVLHIRYGKESRAGSLEILQADGAIFVDGVQVRQNAHLFEGSIIRLSGNQGLRCRFSEGFLDEERTQIESLEVDGLSHLFGKNTKALDQLNFAVKRGEMLCIIGPSGSGKSTLLSILSGQCAPTKGEVKVNGVSLYENRKRLIPFITYMPQEEALNPQLTVREHLRHGMVIRRPGLCIVERESRVDSLLAELGLQRIAHRKIGSPGDKSISGGERSRLNLGIDLGSRAEVFLFDEPISGLSSKDSEHVAGTLRSLAGEKIVIASLHRPGANVLRLFDKVLLLDSEGKLAYFGNPISMVNYFRDACEEHGISHPSLIAQSPLAADFVFDILQTPMTEMGDSGNMGGSRRFSPMFWQERFQRIEFLSSISWDSAPPTRLGEVAHGTKLPIPPKPVRRALSVFFVFFTHFERSILSKIRNRGTLYVTFFEAPLLAALISNTLRSSPEGSYEFSTALHIPAYLFLSVTVAMFLGLMNSVTEILKDRAILRRERNCHPSGFSYVSAKFVTLGLIGSAQCFTYLLVSNYFLEIEGVLLYHWIWMSLTALCGTGMALLISSIVKSERAALTAVPLLLVPQMLLAGALVPFKEMNRAIFNEVKLERNRGGVPVPAYVMPLRYAYEGMLIAQATRNPFELERIRLQRKIEKYRAMGFKLSNSDLAEFEKVKEGLRNLLAAGANTEPEAREIVQRIRKTVEEGSALEISNMKVWPDGENAKPAFNYYVNERVDLLVREAETFRNDYRNQKPRHVFLALKKPIPWMDEELETMRFCGVILLLVSLGGCGLAAWVITLQNRKIR